MPQKIGFRRVVQLISVQRKIGAADEVASSLFCGVWVKEIAISAAAGYTVAAMSDEPEDFNAFNSWDILGAMLMLTLVPAIMNFVFNDKELLVTAVIAGIGVVVSLAVFLLALVTRWRIIGRLVNVLGCVLTTLYFAVAIYLWFWAGDEDEAQPGEPTVQTSAR